MPKVNLKEIYDKVSTRVELRVYSGEEFITSSEVESSCVHLLSLELAGFMEDFKTGQIQILDNFGIRFLETLTASEKDDHLAKIFSYDIPTLILTDGCEPDRSLVNLCNANQVPLLVTNLKRRDFIQLLEGEMGKIFDPKTDYRGTSMEIYGVGVLITGHSGIGKSECAIDLIKRGHRLIGDDIVEITKRGGSVLLARGKYPISHRMELRGIGIIDIVKLMGISSIKDVQKIDMMVILEKWDPDKSYERLGLDEKVKNILDVSIPCVEIPVAPGRNIAILIEVAAMNYRLRKKGIIPAQELEEEVIESFKR